ncbi:hypothetical protein AKJ61_03155 [candidate division MSBL1 archaeon SCGC-AAA259B11]|uniref:Electron transfer flavoprotein alpha/beta-subunit N-terminal domain-containing protein n=1 Tax=candidate division MSBL1 archaeon SCGC-AAA259B11 TaxID=1698260 RepID=A0A133U547_9EURY|nr:hypothetical protein AKJ61_03155 [candidate division MSBL1 archaeon SCGC-AAA259B11]
MILVVAEKADGKIKDITFEMLSKAEELAEKADSEVATLLLTEKKEELVKELENWTDKLFIAENDLFKDFNSDIHKQALSGIIEETEPELILMGHTYQGMELAPGLATKLDIPLISDVTEIVWEDEKPKVEREIFGGKVISEVEFVEDKQHMLTVRPAAFEAREPPGLSAEVIDFEPQISDSEVKREVLGISKPEAGEVDITSSDILVAVGRGIGADKEDLQIIEELADSIGGEICCTRPMVDKEWFPESRLVGQSGKTVTPNLFFAIGISGEFYFTMGMENSENIIAINRDPDAPIYRVADYGVVDDLFEVVPELTKVLQES